jgi:hypothetical protein
MPVRASELPDGVKQQILGKIREQVGGAEYDRLVASVGEDGLIEAVLNQAKSESDKQKKQKRKVPWTWGAIVAIVLLAGVGVQVETWGQFLFLGSMTLVGSFAWTYLVVGVIDLLNDTKTCGGCLTGLFNLLVANIWVFIISISLAYLVGYFVITGDYEGAMQIGCGFWSRCPTPTPMP